MSDVKTIYIIKNWHPSRIEEVTITRESEKLFMREIRGGRSQWRKDDPEVCLSRESAVEEIKKRLQATIEASERSTASLKRELATWEAKTDV